MLLHIHKKQLENTDMIGVANEFIGRFDNRKQIFGKVSQSDMPKKLNCNAKQQKHYTNKYEIDSNATHIKEQRY